MKKRILEKASKKIADNIRVANSIDGWSQERIRELQNHDGKTGVIPITLIKTNENVRKQIDDDSREQKELIASIKVHGLLAPPVVTVAKCDDQLVLVLVAGERRIRALKAIGHDSVTCLVRIFDSDTTKTTASLAENINRLSLHPLDVAESYEELNAKGYQLDALDKMFGHDLKTIKRFLKMASFPEKAKEIIRTNSSKFTTRNLLAMASRRLSPDEVMIKVQDTINKEVPILLPKVPELLDQLNAYFKAKKIKKEHQQVVIQALTDLRLIQLIRYP